MDMDNMLRGIGNKKIHTDVKDYEYFTDFGKPRRIDRNKRIRRF